MIADTEPVWRWKEFQAPIAADQSGRVCYTKARRTGGSEIGAFRAAYRASGFPITPDGEIAGKPDPARAVDVRITSSSERTAQGLLARAAKWTAVLSYAAGENLIVSSSESRLKLSSGREITAHAPSGRTLRGYEGDVIVDEMAHVPGGEETWRAIKSICDPIEGRPAYLLFCVSTPFGNDPNNLMWRCARGDMAHTFVQYTVDIHQAKAKGLVAKSVEELREECGSSAAFREEYEADYADASDRAISEKTYDQARYTVGELPAADTRTAGWWGYDVARAADGDAAARVEAISVGDVLWAREIEAKKDQDWDTQEELLHGVIERNAAGAIDETAIGHALAERLARRWGEYRVKRVNFSSTPQRRAVWSNFVAAFDKQRIRVPRENDRLRRAVLALRIDRTNPSGISYVLPRAGGNHCDECVALALAAFAWNGVVSDARREGESPITIGPPRLTVRAALGLDRPRGRLRW